MATINDVIESLLQYHGFDANTHPFTIEEPKTPAPKRAKKAKKRIVIDEEQERFDPNDNSINRELDEVEAGPSGLDGKKRKLVPYEVMRENNIRERENAMELAGVMPQSKVRKIWKKSDNPVESEDDSDFDE